MKESIRTRVGESGYVELLSSNSQFRRFFTADLVTNVGDSLYGVAVVWLVYELTGSTLSTGLALFAVRAPQVFRFLLGPLVDRFRSDSILRYTQLGLAGLVALVPALLLVDKLTVPLILVIIGAVSVLNQFVNPTQNAAVPELVDSDQLPAANGLISLSSDGTNTLFNGLAGVLITVIGAAALFAIDVVTFLIAAALYTTITISDANDEGEDPSAYVEKLRGGFQYLRSSGSILVKTLIGSSILNVLFGAVLAVLPAFAAARGGPGLYGILVAAFGLGSVIGSTAAEPLKRYPMGVTAVCSYIAIGGFVASTVMFQHVVPLTILFTIGLIPVGVVNVLILTHAQTIVPEDLLGRVMATLGSAAGIAIPVGSLTGGLAGEYYSAEVVVVAASLGIASISLYWIADSSLRTLPPVTEMN